LTDQDLKVIQALNSFDKKSARGSWTGGSLVRSGGCVECSLTAMHHTQKQLGAKVGANTIQSIAYAPSNSEVKGQSIQNLQTLFDQGKIKVGDVISMTTQGNLGLDHARLANGGKGTNNHAAIVTAQLNPATGKYEVRLIDNDSKTAKSSSLQEFVSFTGNYSPVIYSVQRPDYGLGNASSTTTASNQNKTLAGAA